MEHTLMKHFITGSILVSLISSVGLVGCKARDRSKTRDIGGSPADVSKAPYVVFLTSADLMVHKGECPPNSKPVNRNCPGLKDLTGLSPIA
jgi:hypothetical protein